MLGELCSLKPVACDTRVRFLLRKACVVKVSTLARCAPPLKFKSRIAEEERFRTGKKLQNNPAVIMANVRPPQMVWGILLFPLLISSSPPFPGLCCKAAAGIQAESKQTGKCATCCGVTF